jgi:hypothetical protein
MSKFNYLDNEKFTLLHHGFDGSVIYNKETKQQEFVSNREFNIPVRLRYKYSYR